jgi:hypothetical protein
MRRAFVSTAYSEISVPLGSHPFILVIDKSEFNAIWVTCAIELADAFA